MNRRHFITTLAGALLAPKVDAAPAIGSFRGYLKVEESVVTPMGQLTNAKLDEIYAILQQSASAAWTERYREAYSELADRLHHVRDTPLTLGPVRVDGETG